MSTIHFLPKKLRGEQLSVVPEADAQYKQYLYGFFRNNEIHLTSFQEIRRLYSEPDTYTSIMGCERIMNKKKYIWAIFPATSQNPAFTLFIPEHCVLN